MARLINADKWAQYYSEERNRTPVANDYEAGQNDALDRVDTWLEEQPTIEAAPVVHGRWEEVDDVWGDVHYRCSACDYEWFLEDGTPAENGMNYCPNCGAKMDGERRDDDA